MALRRREKRTEQSKVDATPPWETRQRSEPDPTTGPWDIRDQPEDETPRVDLGSLRVPVVDGMEIRLDVNESQQVISATVVNGNGSMQLGVFAAPRNEGIWDEVRVEIMQSMLSQGGAAREQADGLLGPEIVGKLRVEGGTTPVRFIGVDGPRWLLRAMILGPAAIESAKAAAFENLLRDVVVVRGADPLPVREPVPLKLPAQALEAAEAAAPTAVSGGGHSAG
ncbi:MAG: DUF3710 domain-containing protein [Actinobacteria bacterium]|nr:DUF3710 domain-containing protein [Actinomycetota bacterium]